MAGRLRPTFLRPLLNQSLLLIILDHLRRANFRFAQIKPDFAKGTSLSQGVPALIQSDLDLHRPITIGLVECPVLVQSVFLCDKVLNVIADRLISNLILHESLLQRGCNQNGQALMLRSPETAVNRCSGQHDESGVGCQKKENVPEPFRGAWRGSGGSGLFGLSRLFGLSGLVGSTDGTNNIDEIDKTDPRPR